MGRHMILHRVYGGLVNLWVDGVHGPNHVPVTELVGSAIEMLVNAGNDPVLKPRIGTQTNNWMEALCKVLGPMPFEYTCSTRLNVIVRPECGFSKIYSAPESISSIGYTALGAEATTIQDQIVYVCKEFGGHHLVEVAEAIAKELVNIIFLAYGRTSFLAVSMSHWSLSSAIGLPPTPVALGLGIHSDSIGAWNAMYAQHMYLGVKADALLAMAFAYASQDQIMGQIGVARMAHHSVWADESLMTWGRGCLDYFLAYSGTTQSPATFQFLELDTEGIDNPFASFWLNFHVALAVQCIHNSSHRPVEPEYQLPSDMADHPWWDCSTYQTFWSANTSIAKPTNISMDLNYGGAAVFRLAFPEKARIEMSEDAAPEIRTKVVAAGDMCGTVPTVQEMRPGADCFIGLCQRHLHCAGQC